MSKKEKIDISEIAIKELKEKNIFNFETFFENYEDVFISWVKDKEIYANPERRINSLDEKKEAIKQTLLFVLEKIKKSESFDFIKDEKNLDQFKNNIDGKAFNCGGLINKINIQTLNFTHKNYNSLTEFINFIIESNDAKKFVEFIKDKFQNQLGARNNTKFSDNIIILYSIIKSIQKPSDFCIYYKVSEKLLKIISDSQLISYIDLLHFYSNFRKSIDKVSQKNYFLNDIKNIYFEAYIFSIIEVIILKSIQKKKEYGSLPEKKIEIRVEMKDIFNNFIKSKNAINRFTNEYNFDLRTIIDFLTNNDKKKIIYKNNVLLSFQIKPFIIFSGISGSGKTREAKKICEILTSEISVINDKKNKKEEEIIKHSEQWSIIAVRPDWQDKKALFGFYNQISQKYETTEFLKLLIKAIENKDKDYVVVLDEMNIAKVEYYFSDFLSAMESGEPIILHNKTESIDGVHPTIKIPSNFYVIGTVNVDETVEQFSKKVLDRANVIEFNEVNLKKFQFDGSNNEDDEKLKSEIEEWKKIKAIKTNELSDRPDENLKNVLEDLNKKIEKYLPACKFGYRTVCEISKYISLIKKLNNEQCDLSHIDSQICQRILPKISGQLTNGEELFKKIIEVIEDKIIIKVPDTKLKDKEKKIEIDKQIKNDKIEKNKSKSLRKLNEMLDYYKETGSISFFTY